MIKIFFLNQKLQFIETKDPDLQVMRIMFFLILLVIFAFLHLVRIIIGPNGTQLQYESETVLLTISCTVYLQ